MTALRAVAAHLPSRSVPVASLQKELDLSDGQLRVMQRVFGLSEVLREPTGTVAELMLAAARGLDGLRGHEHLVRYVVQARTMPAVAPYPVNPLHEVRKALGLGHAQVFSVFQHACASGLLAVDLCGKLLAADGDPEALALVLTGEKTFTPAARTVPGTAVNGEAAAAVLVGVGGERDRVLGYATRTHGRFNAALSLTPEVAAQFQQAYPAALAEVLLAAAARAGTSLDELALILPHNVNRVSWVRLCRDLGIPLEKVLLENVPVTGHCFCADPFLNYRTAADRGLLRPGDRYLMAAVGLGATFSAMVLQH
ncbi:MULTISPECIES: 3-oxoacyl-[acyl-carrier-protein] synthase III C-terminal domain-containing protein [Streptomyces]|uniref:3-oxoacyl-[acyl-carrier-protein] synthase III C-terminal domain-containing protein n=1 Tax=Streptomyces TaxID=1883 RepID=UPI001039628C|nr:MULTISPECIES: 3-oxoacyl-[acyl-carrier-protein] synthase III C-terminal domain-containing protein [Streptomyces]MBT3073219.1 3-oxoacyl-ACP synthase [Streptomyces sp. COG21]MBT3081622.1 3-oxoacyl-ACP synthase [Streptomyces sp. COG20]MBT3085206.1 3-oxoacyl-ACP synthase [Streptomyces sp. CYG21]MBT3096754.1 3-oxoacyl-ACP synthase [Streptomyces sp. CBG30]MBT3105551.1 3-oxoacyl-ACP synthase [Streptomyces sp. COG19]